MNPELMKMMMKYNMSCKEVEEFLMDYLEGNLGFCTRTRFRLHILMCPDCSKYIEEYKNTVSLNKSMFELINDESIEDVPEEIINAILSIKKTSGK